MRGRTLGGEEIGFTRANVSHEVMLGDLFDGVLRREFFLTRRQLHEVVTRPTSDVWIVHQVGEVLGVAVVYGETRLHNLFLVPWARGKGIGELVMRLLDLAEVRAKSDMRSGDPTGFYEQLGFKTTETQGKNGQINVMSREGKADECKSESVTTERHQELLNIEQKWLAYREACRNRARLAVASREKNRALKGENRPRKPGKSQVEINSPVDSSAVQGTPTGHFVNPEDPANQVRH